jgi:hypothetical protein
VCSNHKRLGGAAVSHPTSRELAASTPPVCGYLGWEGLVPLVSNFCSCLEITETCGWLLRVLLVPACFWVFFILPTHTIPSVVQLSLLLGGGEWCVVWLMRCGWFRPVLSMVCGCLARKCANRAMLIKGPKENTVTFPGTHIHRKRERKVSSLGLYLG